MKTLCQTIVIILLSINISHSAWGQSDTIAPRSMFDFDEITWIHLDVNEDEYNEKRMADPGGMSRWTVVLKKHIRGKGHLEAFFEQLKLVEYTETTIDPSHYDLLRDSIFIEQFCTFVKMSKGDAFYNNIFVFKKKGEAVGIAKLSLSDNTACFAPNNVFSDCFGQFGEFQVLKDILESQ